MIVCKKKKLVYFHNPKTAGSSITKVLAPHSTKAKELDGLVMGGGWQGKFHHDGNQHQKMTLTQYGEFKDYFKFSFVRNPFDIVLSFWEKSTKDRNYGTLEEFLLSNEFPGERALRYTQTEYLDVNNLDYVGRYENIVKDWQWLAFMFDLDTTLPTLNNRTTKQHNHYREYYTTLSRKIVEERYQKDLEVFEYDF